MHRRLQFFPREGLQALAAGPRNAIPAGLLHNLGGLHFPTEGKDVEVSSRAARFRYAAHSAAFLRGRELLYGFVDDNECSLAWIRHPLWLSSLTRSVVVNYDSVLAVPSAPDFGGEVFKARLSGV